MLSTEKTIVEYVNLWAKDFQNSIIDDDYNSYSFLMGSDGSQHKSKKLVAFLQKSLERQIVFIKYFATCRLLENQSKSNLQSINRLVSLQHFDLKFHKTSPRFEVCFYFSKGRKVYLFVNDLNEINFADIYAATLFEAISISNHEWKYLTKTILNSILKTVHEDMACDRYFVKFGIPEQYSPGKNNSIIYTVCEVDRIPSQQNDYTEYCEKIIGTSDVDIDKIAKIRKANDLFGIDMLKWFKP